MKINNQKVCLSIFIMFGFLLCILLYDFIIMRFNIMIPCVFHKLTGLYCPGCGITRMVMAILHFQFIEALHYNCFIFCLLPILIIYGFIFYIHWVQDISIKKVPTWSINTLLVLFILFGVIRNIPLFSFFAPIS